MEKLDSEKVKAKIVKWWSATALPYTKPGWKLEEFLKELENAEDKEAYLFNVCALSGIDPIYHQNAT
jgi:hypothetical protein